MSGEQLRLLDVPREPARLRPATRLLGQASIVMIRAVLAAATAAADEKSEIGG